MEKPYFLKLKEELKLEYGQHAVRPAPADIFRAFQLTPIENVRVLMLGQDPYPYRNEADGLAFSSKLPDTPASLRYILREVDRDVVRSKTNEEYKQAFPTNQLDSWAKQGVFLLNTSLTVRAGEPKSHEHLGWHEFIHAVITKIHQYDSSKIFVGWGSEAQKILSFYDTGKYYHLYSGHPASGAHGKDKFSGCNHFSKINYYFYRNNEPEIDWKLYGTESIGS